MAQIVRRIVYSAAAPITISGYTIGLDYNTTNLQVNGGALDTIQDIDTGATPTFVGIQNTVSALQLNAGVDQDVTLFANAGSGQNPGLLLYGYITAASGARYYRVGVDDVNDEVIWSVQDSYITGFAIQLPDNAGGTEWRIKDSDGAVVASINSDGKMAIGGAIDTTYGLVVHDVALRYAAFKEGAKHLTIEYGSNGFRFTTRNSIAPICVGAGGTDYVKFATNGEVTLHDSGVLQWGSSGISSPDTNLYRADADTLKTDDKFVAASAQFGTDTDYLAIAEDGELTLAGDSRVRGFMRLDPKRFKVPATNYPGETFEGIFYTLDFDDSTEESAYAEVEIPCDWDNTTDISVSVYWFHDNADNGAVKWGLEYRAIKCGETVSDATTTITEVSDGNHAAGELVCTTFTTGISAVGYTALS